MGNRKPVTLVSIVVKRNNAVVPGNLCEASIPPTTIKPTPNRNQSNNDMQKSEGSDRHP
jgi:hypothetical protein